MKIIKIGKRFKASCSCGCVFLYGKGDIVYSERMLNSIIDGDKYVIDEYVVKCPDCGSLVVVDK